MGFPIASAKLVLARGARPRSFHRKVTMSEHKRFTPVELCGADLIEYLGLVSDEVEWMADGFISDPSISMLYATDGIGKSLIGVQMALEMASGLPVFKTFNTTRDYKVIYCMAERSIKEPVKRIKKMIGDSEYAGKIKFENLTITTEFQGKDISNIKNCDDLMGVLHKHAYGMGGCDLLVFDPLYALVKGDLKDDEPINAVFNFFRRAGTELQSNIFFFHHENRGTREIGAKERTGQDFYGNKFISGLCTSVYHMKREVKEDHFKTVLINEKDTESALIPRITLVYEPEYGNVSADINSSPKSKEIAIDIFLRQAFKDSKNFKAEEMFASIGISIHPVNMRKTIAKLLKQNKIKNVSEKGFVGLYKPMAGCL